MDLAAGFLPAVASTGSLVRNESAQSLIRSSSTQLLTIVPQPVKGVGQGFFFGIFSGLGAAVSGTALSVARRVYPEFLDPISANIINEDPEFVCNVHVAIQLFGAGGEGADEFIPVTLAEIKGVFESVAQKFSRFRERVVVRNWGWPYWEACKEFDFESHFQVVEGEEWTGEKLEAFVSREFSVGLDRSRPLWKVFLFPKVRVTSSSGGEKTSELISVFVFKYSHAIGDGYHIVRATMSDILERQWASSKPVKSGGAGAPPTPPGNAGASSADRGQSGASVTKILPAVSKVLFLGDDKPNAVKAGKVMTGTAKRVGRFATTQSSLDDLKKAVKRENELLKAGAPALVGTTSTKNVHLTLNDVLFGCLSSGLTNFAKLKHSPLTDDLTAVIWVALKSLNNLYLPDSVLPIEELNNDTLGSVYVKLPRETNNHKASLEVSNRFSKLKGSPEPLLTNRLRGGFGVLPKGLTNLVWPALSNKTSLSVSSLPGPNFEVEFVPGHRVKNVAFWVPPVGSISLFVTIITFNGRISVAMSSDASTIVGADLGELCDMIIAEIDRFCGVKGGAGIQKAKL